MPKVAFLLADPVSPVTSARRNAFCVDIGRDGELELIHRKCNITVFTVNKIVITWMLFQATDENQWFFKGADFQTISRHVCDLY